MLTNERADMIAGGLVALCGLGLALYVQSSYPLGTLRRMGPGMFPVGLGLALAGLGAALALSGWLRGRAADAAPAVTQGIFWRDVQWRPAVLTLIGIVAFALLIQRAGLIPAAIAVVAISAFADIRNTARSVVVLSAVLCGLAVIIFKLALGMTFNLYVWPL